jgi:hypothetical protein
VGYKTMQETNSKGAENTLFTNSYNREPHPLTSQGCLQSLFNATMPRTRTKMYVIV